MKKTIEKAPWIGGVLITIPAFPNLIWVFLGLAVLSLNFIYWKNIQKTKTVLFTSTIMSLLIFLKVFLSIIEEFAVKLTDLGYTPFPRSGIILIGSIWTFLYSFNEYKNQKTNQTIN
jgi:hypothetical protein